MTLSPTRLSQISLAALLTCYFAVGLQAQSVIYVTETGAGTQDGSSWENASADLRAEMAAAQSGEEIWVAQGTYYPTQCNPCEVDDRSLSFELKSNVRLIGGFIGNETNAGQASPSRVTTLSGEIGTSDRSDNTANVIWCNNCGTQAEIRNLTVRGGFANLRGAADFSERLRAGSALYCSGSGNGSDASPVVSSCLFTANTAYGSGGAIFLNGGFGGKSSPSFNNCVIENNTAYNDGGAVFFFGAFGGGQSDPRFLACSFVNNRTIFDTNITSTGQTGGAVNMSANRGNARPTFDRCRFDGNSADDANANGNGASVYAIGNNGNAVLTFRNTVFTNGNAFAGGAIYVNQATTNLTNCTITNNVANGGGGGGGGLYTNGGTSNVTNCIIYENFVTNNQFQQDTRTLKNVNATVNIAYTLVEAANADQLNAPGGNANNSSSTVNDGAGMIYDTDPEFAFSGDGLPELSATSPAADVGDNSTAALPGDYFNNERIEGEAVDLGAFERGAVPLPVELLSFRANSTEDRIYLDWLTAAEIDLEGYRLERSADGARFERLSFTNAAALGGYTYTDFTALPQTTYYYRLVSIDFDGTTYTSDLVTAQLGVDTGAGLVRRAYPNPTSGNLFVHLSESNRGPDLRASLYDGLGREVQRWSEPGSTGAMQLDLGGFANGLYTLSVARGGHTETLRVLLRH